MWTGYGRYDEEPMRQAARSFAQHCGNCGMSFVGGEDRFCRKCGSPRREVTRDPNQCTCGAIVSDKDKHCYSCGKKVRE